MKDFDYTPPKKDLMGYISQADYMNIFAMRVRTILKLKNMTQQNLSDATDIDVTIIGKYLRGVTVPSIYRVYKIASALGCSINDLVYIEEDKMNRYEMEIGVARILSDRDVHWYDDPATGIRHIYTENPAGQLTNNDKRYLLQYFKLIAYPCRIIFD